MKIAVIGAGTGGLVATWLLDKRHDVTLFERDSVIGGNIRTLGGNVACPLLPSGVRLDAGVVEFDRRNFRRFHALMRVLGVEVEHVPITTGLFLADGSGWHAPDRLEHEFPGRLERLVQKLRHAPLLLARRKFLGRIEAASARSMRESKIDDFLDDDVFGKWIRMLLMYAYSIPYDRAGEIGAVLAIPMLDRFLVASDWTRVVGGVWTYVERILANLRASVIAAAEIEAVARLDDGVTVALADGGQMRFDAVVLAVTPDQVLPLLADATADERRWFGAWRANRARTVVHCDTGIYRRRGIRYYCEFDLFETASGAHGYNAYLNRLCGIPSDSTTHYSLAYNLDDEIDPDRIIHEQDHVTPLYNVEALAWREEVLAANGENRVWYAGAWLGDGLQEGAVISAERVAVALGGRAIDLAD